MVTSIEYPSRKIGAMLHRRRLGDAPEFTSSFVPMIRIAMERDRLHRDLVAKLDQLRASRRRIVRAGDEERRRLERNLHDGAQQRLAASLIPLRALERRLRGQDDLEPLVTGALTELQGAMEDLRELARGLHPPLLAREGLAAALEAGANRSALPVELDRLLYDGKSRSRLKAARRAFLERYQIRADGHAAARSAETILRAARNPE